MSDWVQESFGGLAGAKLHIGPIKQVWKEGEDTVDFEQASTEWLLDLRYRILTGHETLKPTTREVVLADISSELSQRAQESSLYTVEQVKRIIFNLLEDVVVNLANQSDACDKSAEEYLAREGCKNQYFEHLERAHFLWSLKNYLDRVRDISLTDERISKLSK